MRKLIAVVVCILPLLAEDLGNSRKGLVLSSGGRYNKRPAVVELLYTTRPDGVASRNSSTLIRRAESFDKYFGTSANPVFSFDENSVIHGGEIITFKSDGSLVLTSEKAAQKKYGIQEHQSMLGKIDDVVYYSENDLKALYRKNLRDGSVVRLAIPKHVLEVCGVARGENNSNVWLWHTEAETRWWAPQAINWEWTLLSIQSYNDKLKK